MNLLFLTLEPLIYIGGVYLLLYKKDLAIFYLPAIFFSKTVIVSVLPASIWYAYIFLYISVLIYYNPTFFKKNIFAILLLLLHLALIPNSTDLIFIRPALFSVIWLFLLVPLAMSILEKYDRKTLFEHLSNSAFIILTTFLTNILFSTIFSYSPYEMYGIKSGILYGQLVDTDFNILAVIIFIALFSQTYKFNIWQLSTTILSIAAIGLSMRRSVIGACILAFILVLAILIVQGHIKQVLSFLIGLILVVTVVAYFTNFTSLFKERFEHRNLAQRELSGEARFAEYAILYQDAFIHHDLNPWIGYELLNSKGKYGKGIFGNRSLHADITAIIHSVGVIGLIFYFLMVGKIFKQAIENIKTKTDSIIIIFCLSVFVIFTITGRYTQSHYMLSLFLLLLLPTGKTSSRLRSNHSVVFTNKLISQ